MGETSVQYADTTSREVLRRYRRQITEAKVQGSMEGVRKRCKYARGGFRTR